MRTPEVLAKPSAEMILAECLVKGTSQAIEDTERRGVEALRASDLLPIRIQRGERATLEAAGVVFGETADELFVHATMPQGWRIEAGENAAYWSNLVDETGRKRASMFYKAAWYDRDAFMFVE